jgi:hypothetical protein
MLLLCYRTVQRGPGLIVQHGVYVGQWGGGLYMVSWWRIDYPAMLQMIACTFILLFAALFNTLPPLHHMWLGAVDCANALRDVDCTPVGAAPVRKLG